MVFYNPLFFNRFWLWISTGNFKILTMAKQNNKGNEVRIARVFPTRTSMSPIDPDAYFDAPDLFTPKYDEIHISTVFTWDIDKAYALIVPWTSYGWVKVGGPALDHRGEDFVPGMYLKEGITITSRGCPNRCWYCLAAKREGDIRELPIREGNIIQDNNLLACSSKHIEKVFCMLKNKRGIQFKGGFESSRVTPKLVEQLRGLAINQIWFACDSFAALKPLKEALKLLRVFSIEKLFCYVLIGKDRAEEEVRLKEVYQSGCLPFAQLYQPPDKKIKYDKEWKDFARFWCRPAMYRSKTAKGMK